MKSRFLSLSTLLLAVGLAIPANAQSFLRHQPDFFQEGRQQFERQIQQEIQREPIAADILLVHDLPPMPPDFIAPTANPKPSSNENNNTNPEQLPSTNSLPNQDQTQ